jgi:hypothetical protein
VLVASVVDVRFQFTQVGEGGVDQVGDAQRTPDGGGFVRRTTTKLLDRERNIWTNTAKGC